MSETKEQLALANLQDLRVVHRAIEGLNEDAILKIAAAAAFSSSGGWLAQARAIGELQRRARYASAAVSQHAKRLGISRAAAFELGAIDREILLPRLREKGNAARFPIPQKRFYTMARRLAPSTRRSALAILAMAESARAKNRRFTTRQLRELLGVDASVDPTKSIASCLVKLSTVQRKARQRYARSVADPVAALRIVEAVAENTRHLVADLTSRLAEAD